jgi:hypothetical protein
LNSRGLSTKSGPRVNIEQVQGPFCKVARIIWFLNYFLMGKRRGPGPYLMDHGSAGPLWTLDRGSTMTSPELGLAAALRHGGSPVMAQWEHGESASGFTEARVAVWQLGDGSEEMAEEALCADGA